MINDATTLTFYFDDGRDAIRPSALAAVTAELEEAFRRTVGPLGPATATLYLVAEPTGGCIRFKLRVDIEGEFDPAAVVNAVRAKRGQDLTKIATWAAVAGSTAAVGALLWSVVFGELGVIDLAVQSRANPPIRFDRELPKGVLVEYLWDPRPDPLPMSPGHPIPAPDRYLGLYHACREAGAVCVTIQLPDESPVAIIGKPPA